MKQSLYLPVLTYPDEAEEKLLANAVDLGRNLGATLFATILNISIPAIVNPLSVLLDAGEMVREAERRSRQNGEGLANTLAKLCGDVGVKLDIEKITVLQPDALDVVVAKARLRDLTVVESSEEFSELAEAMIFGAGRPVLLYPKKLCSGRFDHIAIAWDGSRAAARALGDAADFLDKASRVSILTVVGEKSVDETSGNVLASIFRKQGRAAEAVSASLDGRGIGDAIQSTSVELQADLLVMGAYGHPRMREFILGGATSEIMGRTRLPVLMSH